MEVSAAKSTTKASGGRPQAQIVQDNFKLIEKLNNKTNRWKVECIHCEKQMVNRENKHIKHLTNTSNCPNVPAEVKKAALIFLASKNPETGIEFTIPDTIDGPSEATSAVSDGQVSKKRKGMQGTLGGYVDHSLSETAAAHASLIFLGTEVRPLYKAPSRFVLSHSLLDMEAARVKLEEEVRLKSSNRLTLLIDGWEDILRRSLYGFVAAEVGKFPVMLSLENMTGARATGKGVADAARKSLESMGITEEIAKNHLIAVTTDNPTVMISTRRDLQNTFWWILTFPCFLHLMNTCIGEICTYPEMKTVVTKALKEEAAKRGITRGLKGKTDTCFYSLSLMALSILTNKAPLTIICVRDDARRKINGLSPVNPDVLAIVHDQDFWRRLDQLARVIKPLVDAIGNVEARDANLADCMLELIRCARSMLRVGVEEGDDFLFSNHARVVYNRRFYQMDTEKHYLALFLHPLCRKLAISDAARGHSFEDMKKAALGIAKQWRWSSAEAKLLIEDLRAYQANRAPFAGGARDALSWWEQLPIDAKAHPLKKMAIILHSVVPHTAELEHLFSQLSGTQSPKRCNFTVEMFETLGKLRGHYSAKLWQHHKTTGKAPPSHGPPPFAAPSDNDLEPIGGLELITEEEIEEAFGTVTKQITAERAEAGGEPKDPDGHEVLEGRVYSWDALEKVDAGLLPMTEDEELTIVGSGEGGDWDIDNLLNLA
ncbi:ribonuclease H-like domain-containing protein [Ephemerocybe angulata]|uniref:Ribonuclease H-like domain-containing protein n=1 Tax=Ephemerocybe angulata TaxID=980116 RepID=A0A8H6MBI9_9AGAR|nr:ribonuclease H-like domain-containing protein [Tulosesus angulatus]